MLSNTKFFDSLFFALCSLLFSTSFLGAKTAVYSGLFDPPTAVEVECVRSALIDPAVDRVVVLVERLPQRAQEVNSSSYERIAMLQSALDQARDKPLEIVSEPWSGKKCYLQKLAAQEEVEHREMQKEGMQDINNQLHCAITTKIYAPEATSIPLPHSFISLKQRLHEESFRVFQRSVALLFPENNLHTTALPHFQPLMTDLGRVDQFIYSVIRERELSGEKAEKFGQQAEKLLTSSLHNKIYAKLHSVQRVIQNSASTPSFSSRPVGTLFSLALPRLVEGQKHTMDIEAYCSDRFPKALIESLLFQEETTYFHQGSTKDAIAYHQFEGYTEVYEINSQAVRKLRAYHLVRNPTTSSVRFIVSNLLGEDTLRHVAYQFGVVSQFNNVQLVRHAATCPLFTILEQLQGVLFQPNDTLIIGFKNAISRRLLKNSEWVHTPFSESGLHIDICENTKTKKKIILSKCVFGDQLLELLNFFYKRGVRRYHYFGTAGSLSSDIHIGDAIIPLAFATPLNPCLRFHNRATSLVNIVDNPKVKVVPLHGWVQSPVQETEQFLKGLLRHGSQSIDVEARYYGEFCEAHPNVAASMVLFVSDEPFGKIGLEQFNTMEHYVDSAFAVVIDPLLSQLNVD